MSIYFAVALSDMLVLGIEVLLINHRKANMNVSSVKSIITSKCKARVLALVKRQIHTLVILPSNDITFSAPVKTTPVTENGVESSSRS